MKIDCVLEHNGNDSILYADKNVGAFTRGASKEEAIAKMPEEIRRYRLWQGEVPFDEYDIEIVQEKESGFEKLESMANYLSNDIVTGSYDELWSVRKVLRRFIWHDRIHAKAMYRMGIATFGEGVIPDVFGFTR
jgi:hypothetical protein